MIYQESFDVLEKKWCYIPIKTLVYYRKLLFKDI